MTNPPWAPALWSPTPWPPFPEELPPIEPPLGIDYQPFEPAVFQAADWTCSAASSAWMLNSVGDWQLGRKWDEWDVGARVAGSDL